MISFSLVKSKVKDFVSEKVLKACPVVASTTFAVGTMMVDVSAEEGTGSFDTVLSYATKALTFCTSNDVMSIIFYCSMAGAVFYVIRCARRSVR